MFAGTLRLEEMEKHEIRTRPRDPKGDLCDDQRTHSDHDNHSYTQLDTVTRHSN